MKTAITSLLRTTARTFFPSPTQAELEDIAENLTANTARLSRCLWKAMDSSTNNPARTHRFLTLASAALNEHEALLKRKEDLQRNFQKGEIKREAA